MAVVLYEKRGHVAYVTINRPERMNAVDSATYERLAEAFTDFAADRHMRVAIVTGAGERAFSAGADLKEYAGSSYAASQERFWRFHPHASLQHRTDVFKPVIAAINGYCLAGGLELALACDVRIAAEHAVFGAPEVKRGLLNSLGCILLPRIIGQGEALRLVLTGRHIDAQEALRLRLVSEVVPAGKLMPRAEALAAEIAENAPLAVQLCKELMLRSQSLPLHEALRLREYLELLNRGTEDSREGPRAFAEKRPAQFQGR